MGDEAVCQMWYQHYKALYNCVVDPGSKSEFEWACLSRVSDSEMSSVLVQDVSNALLYQKIGKCPGPNGLCMEAFIYACNDVRIHLALYCLPLALDTVSCQLVLCTLT